MGNVKAYTREEVISAHARCSEAQTGDDGWGSTTFAERRAVLADILDWVLNNQETIMSWSVQETGKTVTEALLGEVMTTCEKIRWIIANGEACLKPEKRPVPTLLAFTKTARVEWSPLGVIGIIVPWNYPVHNVFSAVVAALFAGNGALVKVSEHASLSAGPMEDVFRRILAKRGHNPNLVQIITGYGQTGASLVESGIDKILFIGSPGVGKLIMRGASQSKTEVIHISPIFIFMACACFKFFSCLF